MEAKLKHLDYIQSAISRMATNSFLFKGWAITLATGLSALAAVNTRVALVAIALISTILFWSLDGYYLWLERGFRCLHKKVAALDEGAINFDMRIDKSHAVAGWLKACMRAHMITFYGAVAVIELVGIAVIGGSCEP